MDNCLVMSFVRASLQHISVSSLKGLHWEPQIGNPKNIAGI